MGIGGKQFPSELAEGLRVLCTFIVLRMVEFCVAKLRLVLQCQWISQVHSEYS